MSAIRHRVVPSLLPRLLAARLLRQPERFRRKVRALSCAEFAHAGRVTRPSRRSVLTTPNGRSGRALRSDDRSTRSATAGCERWRSRSTRRAVLAEAAACSFKADAVLVDCGCGERDMRRQRACASSQASANRTTIRPRQASGRADQPHDRRWPTMRYGGHRAGDREDGSRRDAELVREQARAPSRTAPRAG